MIYNTQTKSMLIGSISGDNISILFNPKLQKLYAGDSIKIIDEQGQGIVAQIYQIENFDLINLSEKEKHSPQMAHLANLIAKSQEDINYLHLANCKIKYSIIANKWVNWRGNLPSITDHVDLVNPAEIISHTVGNSPLNPVHIGNMVSQTPIPLNVEAGLLENNSIIVGDKEKEKSNLLNILTKELLQKEAKILIIDPKGSYHTPGNSQTLEAGKNFKLSLLEYGASTLGNLIAGQTEPGLKVKVESMFLNLTNYAQSQVKDFLPLALLREILERELSSQEGQKAFLELSTLNNRLVAIDKLGIFANQESECPSIVNILNTGSHIVLDISAIPLFWQKVFVRKVIKDLSKANLCVFVFYEDINRYLDNELAVELIYKTKNLGINNIFITNYDDEIPPDVIKQSDNLFLFSTDSLESNLYFFNNMKSDKHLINMSLKRLAENTVLIYGEISNNYPIKVELQDSKSYSHKNVHFGSISKQVSDHGEIIYSYRGSEKLIQKPHKATQEASYPDWKAPPMKQTPVAKDIESLADYALEDLDQVEETPADQKSYMDKYRTLSEEYEEEEYQEYEETAQKETDSYEEFEEEQEEESELYEEEETEYEEEITEDETSLDITDEEDYAMQEYTQPPLPPQPMQQQPVQPRQKMPPRREQIPQQITNESMPPQAVQKQKRPDQDIRSQERQQLPPTQEQIQQKQQRPAPPPRQDHIPEHLEDIPVYAAPSFDEGSVDFKEGDKVHHERYGIGIINRIIVTGEKQLCSIQFQDYGRRLLDPTRGLTKIE